MYSYSIRRVLCLSTVVFVDRYLPSCEPGVTRQGNYRPWTRRNELHSNHETALRFRWIACLLRQSISL